MADEINNSAKAFADGTGEPEHKINYLNEFLDIVESVISSIFYVLLVFTFLFRIATVNGNSMNKTLYNNDKLIVRHLFYEPEQGDIIIANVDYQFIDEAVVKRVIATEGQTVNIDFEAKKVYVDGVALDENYAYYDPARPFGEEGYFKSYPVTVPENCVFVMGDNRCNSSDSRYFGCIKLEDVIGKVVFRYLPANEFGKLD